MAFVWLAWLSMDAECSSHCKWESLSAVLGILVLFGSSWQRNAASMAGHVVQNGEIQVTIYDEVGNVLEASVSEHLWCFIVQRWRRGIPCCASQPDPLLQLAVRLQEQRPGSWFVVLITGILADMRVLLWPSASFVPLWKSLFSK